MEKRRLIKTALCLVLAFAMTFAPIFSSYAMIVSAFNGGVESAEETKPAVTDETASPDEGPSDATQQPASDESTAPDEEVTETQPSDETVTDVVPDTATEQTDVAPEEAAEPEEEQEEEKAVRTEYVWKDGKVKVTARLSDPEAIPDDAELVATAIGKDSDSYNYDAYMEALNANSESSRTDKNTLLYDIAFIKDGAELQPSSGKVSVTFEFLDNQLADSIGAKKAADVNVVHLPLTDKVKDKYDTTAAATDITADDIDVQTMTAAENNLKVSVKNEKVVFKTDDFSVFAYTVDFEYNGYQFSMPGGGSIELSEVFEQLHIDEDVKDVEDVKFSNEELVEVKKNLFGSDWTLKSKKSFKSEESLTIKMNDGTVISITVTDPVAYPVTINFYDFHDNPEAPTGLTGYYLRALIKDNTSGQTVAGDFIPVTVDAASQTYELHFTDRNGQAYDYSSGTATLDIRLIHLVPGEYWTPDPPTDWKGAENLNFSEGYWFQTAPEGYRFIGTDIGESSATIPLEATKPIQLYVRIVSDGSNKPEEDVHDIYAVTQIKHNSGNDTYGVEHIDQGQFTVLEDGTVYCDIPLTKWYSDKDGTEEKYDKFTGKEKNVSSSLYVTAGGQYAEIAIGEYLNEYEVVSYPSIDNGEGTARVIDDSDPEVTKVYDVIQLKKNTDTFDSFGYTLEELLNGGYNIVTLCPNQTLKRTTTSEAEQLKPEEIEQGDAYIGCHQMGGILIRGDAFFAGKVTGVADSPDADSPSVVGGMVGATSHTGCFVNNRTNNTTQTDFYAGSGNSIVGKFINGEMHQQELGGVKHDFNYCGATLVSDTFMDWDRLQNMVIDSSALIATASTKTIKANDGDTIEVALGSNVTIDAPEDAVITVNVVGEGADSADAKGTVVNFLNSGNAIVPKLRVNGQTLNTVETGEGISVVWNYPNATGTVEGPGESEFGHVVAPKALIKITAGNYSGTMIGNNAYIGADAEGHLYPYKGGRIVPANVGLKVGKKISDQEPASDQKYTFKLDQFDTTAEDKWKNLESAQNNGDRVEFDDVQFTAAKTYWLRVSEDAGSVQDGIIPDPRWYLLKVVVVNEGTDDSPIFTETHEPYLVTNQDNLITADNQINTSAIEKIAADTSDLDYTSDLVFNNQGVKGKVGVTKNFVGRAEWGDSDSFTFNITAKGIKEGESVNTQKASEVPMPAATSITIDKATANHQKFFDEVTYTHAGVYVYEITEAQTPKIDGVVYDEGTYVAYVTVAKGSDGKLATTVAYKYIDKEGKEQDATTQNNTAVVTNTLAKGQLKIEKKVTGTTDKTKTFTFKIALTAPEGITLADSYPAKLNGADTSAASVTNGEVTVQLKADEYYEILDLPAGTTYTVTESTPLPSGYNQGTHSGESGTIVADTEATATMNNTYSATGSAVMSAKKAGNDKLGDRTFQFELLDASGKVLQTSAAVKQGETATFNAISYTLADAGKTYTYKIREKLPEGVTETNKTLNGVTYDTSVKTVEVTVTDNKDGTLNVTYNGEADFTTPEFSNDYNATGSAVMSAKKAGNNKLGDRTFQFELLDSSGKVLQTSAAVKQGETATFNAIPYTFADAGKTYTYKIREKLPEGVTETNKTLNGVTYDTSVKTVQVAVTDKGDGTLSVKYNGAATFTTPEFSNDYNATGSLELEGSKSLTGRDFKAGDSFTFTVTGSTGAPMPSPASVTINPTSGKTAAIKFNAISYGLADVGKTYTYTVTESGSGEGITNDKGEHTVTVTITDNGDGTLGVEKKYSDGTSLAFVNTYAAAGTGEILVKKNFTGRNWKDGDSFEFTLTPETADAPMPENNTITVTNDSAASFGTITYSSTGTYVYKVKETEGNLPGVTYDKDEHTVTVTVTDPKHDGKLAVDVKYEDAEKGYVESKNTYNATGSLELEGSKSLTGREFKAGDEFTFTVTGSTGAPMPSPASVTIKPTSGKTAAIKFNAISYGLADVGKTYTYTVEESGKGDGITNDKGTHTVTVEITDNGDGTLGVKKTYNDGTSLAFVNTYDASGSAVMSAKKAGNNKLGDRTFQFELLDSSGKVLQTSAAVKQGETATFNAISYTLADAGKSYTYKIREKLPEGVTETNKTLNGVTYDTSVKTVEVAVADNKDGTLSVKYNGAATFTTPEFSNDYNATGSLELEGSKSLTGREFKAGDEFTFTVTGSTGAPMPSPASVTIKPTSGKTAAIKFNAISYGLADVGKTYTYTVEESGKGDGITNDKGTHTVTVEITDNGDGTLGVKKTYNDGTSLAFVNTYDASGSAVMSAKKAGNNKLGDRTFQFELLDSSGKVLQTSAAVKQGETATFNAISYTLADAGKSYTYKIREKLPEGVTETNKTLNGVTYDTSVKTVEVAVADNKDGTLSVKYNGAATFTTPEFSNDYNATGSLELEGSKSLTGREFKAGDEFTFTVTGSTGAPMPSPASVTINPTSGKTAAIKFNAISYGLADVGKTYTYTVTESGSGDGITNDKGTHTVTVNITDNGDGTLGVDKTYSDGTSLAFVNTYAAAGTGEILVKKNFTGRNWKDGDSFEFTLTPETADAPMPENNTITVTNDSAASFGTITYSSTGTYVYKVKETEGNLPGVTYDKDEHTVTVTVTDPKHDGKLAVDVKYEDAEKGYVESKNTYNATGSLELEGSKSLTGREFKAGDEFTFTVTGSTGAPMPSPASVTIKPTSGKTAAIKFNAISYGLADVGKTYTYKVEESGSGDGITNDKGTHTVTVKITDNGDGTLGVEKKYSDGTSLAFVNTYDASGSAVLSAKKAGNSKLGDTTFQFQLLDASGNVLQTSSAVKQGQTATFNAINYTIADAGKTYTYKIKEVIPQGVDKDNKLNGVTYDTHEETVEVSVTDNKDGTLSVKYNGAEKFTTPEFNNTYSAEGSIKLKATKQFTGREWTREDSFEFTLAADSDNPEGAELPEEVTKNATIDAKTVTFDAIKFTKEGTYKFTITETVPKDAVDGKLDGITYDGTPKEITVKVTDNGNGTLNCVPTPDNATVTAGNTYEAKGEGEIKVKKNLVGRDWTDNDSFEFSLEPVGDAPLPKTDSAIDALIKVFSGKVTVSITKDDTDYTKSFGKITFTKEGTYVYKVTETTKDGNGLTCSERVKTVTIKVKDNGKGELIADGTDLIQTAEITNTYAAKGNGEIKVQKVLEGREWKSSDEFSFTISAEDGAPMPKSDTITIKKSDKNQTKSFGEIEFTEAGTYTYTVKETKGSLGGVTYDETMHTVTIEAVDDGKGNIVAAEGSQLIQTEKFTNTYKAVDNFGEILVQKVLNGREWEDDDEFEFTLTAKGDAPMPEDDTIVITKDDKDHIVGFGQIEFAKPGKYTYIVKETRGDEKGMTYDSKEHKVTFEIVDDGNGKLVEKEGTKLIQTVKITNTYNTGVTTGDYSNVMLYTVTSLTALLVLLIMLIIRRRSKKA